MERSAATPQVPEYGLIGFPLSHSFSPAYFREKFEREGTRASYSAFELKYVAQLSALLEAHPDLQGLNITTPHKQAVIPYLSGISEDAAVIGAVNCIRISEGKLYGYNTDWKGFLNSLQPLLGPQHTAALVLGSGGASLAVVYALEQLGIPFRQVSRKGDSSFLQYDELTAALVAQHHLIINTTTLGTQGQGLPLIPYSALTPDHLLYDLVYNPPLTPFLSEGVKQGAQIKNGLEMLERQAEASWAIWQGQVS